MNAAADRTRTFSGLLGHEMWHRMFKAKKAKRIMMQAYNRLDKAERAEVEKLYREDCERLGLDEKVIKNIGREEVAAAYADSIYGDTRISSIATRENINRFVEIADAETLQGVNTALGVDMRNATPEVVAAAIKQFRDSGKAAEYEGGYRDIIEAKKLEEGSGDVEADTRTGYADIETLERLLESAEVRTQSAEFSGADGGLREGATRFQGGETDIAVIKRGNSYRIYDYRTGKITRALTRSELRDAIKRMRGGERPAIEVIGKFLENGDTSSVGDADTFRHGVPRSEQRELWGFRARGRLGSAEDAWYDGANTVYVNADADRSRTFSGLLGHEMWHRMFKAKKAKRIMMQAYNRLDKDERAEVEKLYREDCERLGLDEKKVIKNIGREEVAAAYAEELFGEPEIWEYILSEEASLADRVLSFFRGANKKYSFEPGMSRAAKKWLSEYKKLFNEVSAYNKGRNVAENVGASDKVRKIERLGRIVESGESAEFRTQNAELDDGSRKAVTKEHYTEYDKPIDMKDVEVLRSIGRKSINKFTSSEIEKAQKWAHKFYKELGTKSPFFRAGFGEWRVYDKTPIEIINIVKNLDVSSGNAINEDTKRKFSWSKDVAKESVINSPKSAQSEMFDIASNLSEIVQKSILLDTVVSVKSSNRKLEGTSWMHSFYCVVNLEGKLSLIKLYAEEAYSQKQNTSFTRAYALKYIQKVTEFDNGVLSQKGGLTDSPSVTVNSISDLYDFVKTYDKDFTPAPEISPLMLNEDGTPRVVYHGTNADFYAFEKGHKRTRGRLNFGEGFYFAVSKDYAQNYIEGKDGKIIEAYVSLKNPYIVVGNSFTEWEMDDIRSKLPAADRAKLNYDNVNDYLAKLGYDGVIGLDYSGTTKTVKTVVAFESTQIKSATDNIGTFDRSNPDIRYALKKPDKAYREKVNAKADEKIAKATAKAEAKYEKKTETAKARLEAEYRTDTTFGEASVKKSFDSVEAISKLKKSKREEIARDLWLELQMSDDAAVRNSFVLKYSVKLYDEIRRADYDAYDNMTYGERDALKGELEAMMKKIVKSGKASLRTKMEGDIGNRARLEAEVRSNKLAEIHQSLKKIDDVKRERSKMRIIFLTHHSLILYLSILDFSVAKQQKSTREDFPCLHEKISIGAFLKSKLTTASQTL